MKNLVGKLFIGNITTYDTFDNISKFASNITSKLQAISMSVIVCCIVIVGCMFIFGEGPSQKAKKWLTYIVVGSLIIFGASTIGSTIKSIGGF